MFFKGKIPFVRLLLPLIVGIASAYLYPSQLIFLWILYFAIFILFLFAAAIIFYKKWTVYKFKWIIGLLIHAFILLTGHHLTLKTSGKFDKIHFSGQSGEALLITIKNEAKKTKNIIRFEADVLHVINGKKFNAGTGKLLVAVKIDSLASVKLSYGSTLIIPFHFTGVEPPYNPGEFNYKAYLSNRQIFHQTFINQSQIVILLKNTGNPLIASALKLRQQYVSKFHKYLSDPQAASLASTLILGYRAELSKEVVDAYSKTGTMHVLSVSGMHVGIVFFVLSFILTPLNKTRKLRLLRAGIIITLIWFYALITGFSPSVCRAAVMLSFVVFGKAINKNQNTYNLIAISAFILLIYNPYYLFDVGFQLSYLAVIGLVFLHPKIYQMVYTQYWLPNQIWSYCALSLAAQLATFPISIYYFHQFPVYFLLSNLLIVIPIILIMYGGIVFMLIPWDFILKPLGFLLNSTIQFTNASLFYIEKLPFSTINGIWIDSYQYLIIYAIGACIILAMLFKNSKTVLMALGLILLLCCSISFKDLQWRNKHEVIFYSLRKNSAVAYVKDRKALILSDLAVSDKTFSFSIDPYMGSTGINEKQYSDFNNDLKNISKRNFIQLGDYKILRFDRSFDKKIFTVPIEVDAVLVSGNPYLNIKKLNQYVKYSILLIDGTNSDYRINIWEKEAQKLDINYCILKKNPAYIVKL